MADFNALETLINAYIKQNGVQAITGQVLNGVLRGMVSALGKGWTIAGAAEPTTDPGTMTGPVAYIAHTAGTYTDFGGLVVNDGEVAFLKYNEQTWTKEVLASLAATASVDGNVGTPSVTTQFVNGVLNFAFHNIKGDPGVDGTDGDAAGFGTVAATVDNTIGTPAVSVSASGPDTAKNFTFAFTGLKGATGVTSAVVTVDNTSGTPQCAVSLVGQELHLDFTGLKGAQGDTGVSADYPITVVNNLTTNDPTSALSAAQGVQLESEISQLDLKLFQFGGLLVPLLKKVAYKDNDAKSLIDSIDSLLNNDELVSITAVYTQPGTIYEGQSLDELKNNLVVTANYISGNTLEVTTYALSGTLTAGTSTITITYQDVTTTFNVIVTDAVYFRDGEYDIAYRVSLMSSVYSNSETNAAVIDGVKYYYTADGSKVATAKKRACYYLFDLLLTAGETYKFEIYYTGKSAGQSLFVGLPFYNSALYADGSANTNAIVNHDNDVVDNGWITPTDADGVLEFSATVPSNCVGVRMAFKVESGGTQLEWPSVLRFIKFAIRKIS